MINWIKFFPLQLRVDFSNEEIKGPSVRGNKTARHLIAGNVVTFRAPKHKTVKPPKNYALRDCDAMDLTFRSYSTHVVANDHWESVSVSRRRWSYLRSWYSGSAGELTMNVSVFKRKPNKRFKDASLFHPRTFEYVIANHLDVLYGHKHHGGEPLYRAPTNWKVHCHLPAMSASFDVEGSNPSRRFVFPVTDHAFVEVVFGMSGNDTLMQDMQRVASAIIDTFTMDLSPEVQRQIDKVNEEHPGLTLTRDFAPLKWPVNPEDIGKGEVLAPQEPEKTIFG